MPWCPRFPFPSSHHFLLISKHFIFTFSPAAAAPASSSAELTRARHGGRPPPEALLTTCIYPAMAKINSPLPFSSIQLLPDGGLPGNLPLHQFCHETQPVLPGMEWSGARNFLLFWPGAPSCSMPRGANWVSGESLCNSSFPAAHRRQLKAGEICGRFILSHGLGNEGGWEGHWRRHLWLAQTSRTFANAHVQCCPVSHPESFCSRPFLLSHTCTSYI